MNQKTFLWDISVWRAPTICLSSQTRMQHCYDVIFIYRNNGLGRRKLMLCWKVPNVLLFIVSKRNIMEEAVSKNNDVSIKRNFILERYTFSEVFKIYIRFIHTLIYWTFWCVLLKLHFLGMSGSIYKPSERQLRLNRKRSTTCNKQESAEGEESKISSVHWSIITDYIYPSTYF